VFSLSRKQEREKAVVLQAELLAGMSESKSENRNLWERELPGNHFRDF
jgi:hypothetical protein